MAEDIYAEKKQKKKKRRKKHYFLRLLLVIALIVGAIFALRSELFNVRNFYVSGNSYYTAAQVCEKSGLLTGINMFEQRLEPAKEALLADPYIKSVSIKRRPMSTIEIIIEERTEYACLPYSGQYIIIDNEGMALRLSDTEPTLPLLDGMRVETMEPGTPLGVEQGYMLTNTLELLKVMTDNDIYFKKIFFSTVIVKAYIYDDLYCEGKPEHITAQMASVKRLVEEQYAQGITRGVIKVGKDNYIAFSPSID